MDWSFSARFVCSLRVSNAFQSSLRVLESVRARCSMLKFHQVSHLNKAQSIRNFWRRLYRDPEHEGRVQVEPAIPRQSNLFEQMVHPVEPRWTPLHHWAGSTMVYKGDSVTMLSWSVFDSALWGNQRRFCGAVQGCSSRDALCNESRLSSLDIGNTKELTLTTLTHVIGSTYYIPYSLIYIPTFSKTALCRSICRSLCWEASCTTVLTGVASSASSVLEPRPLVFPVRGTICTKEIGIVFWFKCRVPLGLVYSVGLQAVQKTA